MPRSRSVLSVLALALLASSCSNDGTASCFALIGPASLIYPIPGSTGVPDTLGSLVFFDAPNADQISLHAGSATIQAGAIGAPPSPLPSPIATLLSSSVGLQGASVPALQPATTYDVSVFQPNGVDCGPARSYSIGRFTTR